MNEKEQLNAFKRNLLLMIVAVEDDEKRYKKNRKEAMQYAWKFMIEGTGLTVEQLIKEALETDMFQASSTTDEDWGTYK